MSRIRWYGPSLVLLITALVIMIAGPRMAQQIAWAQTDAKISLVRETLSQNPSLAELSDAFRKVATVVEPSVVHVQVLSRNRGDGPGGEDRADMLRRFFGPQFDIPGVPEQEQQPQSQPNGANPFDQYDPARPSGNGSGFVYNNGGHIITNNHVVAEADEVRVRFQDGSEYDAEVVGRDPATDVAVLKIEADNLHPATVSDQNVEAGDIVFAFGSPFGFDFSMSQGIVSAKGRKLGIIGGNSYENFIQTDAAINPGNSGGPLTNIYGQVVGMNTAIASRTGVYNGLGFAIPVSMVTQVADQIIKSGKVSRGYLGVFIEDLDPKMAKTFGFEGKGVLVVGATEGESPAVKAGIQGGDIISEVNDKRVTTADELRYLIAGLPPGSEVKVKVFRDGKTDEKTITLGELPSQAMARSEAAPQDTAEHDSKGMEVLEKFGIESVQDFNREIAQRIGATFEPGVLVAAVRSGSIADTQGIARGMLITDVQGEAVENVADLAKAIESRDPTQGIRIRVQIWNPQTKAYQPRFVLLELPKD